MSQTAKKDAVHLGTLVRPNGTRLPVTGLLPDGKISVMGVYVEFETTIGAAITSGYSLEDASPELSEAWDNAAERRQAPPLPRQSTYTQGVIHVEANPDRDR